MRYFSILNATFGLWLTIVSVVSEPARDNIFMLTSTFSIGDVLQKKTIRFVLSDKLLTQKLLLG
jgi:hypothetical protein